MTSADDERFRAVMTALSLNYRAEISVPLMSLYWKALQDWAIGEFEAAAQHLMRSCPYMPKLYDFEQYRAALIENPNAVWAEVISSCSNWRHPRRLPGGLMARAVQMVGGWRHIAMADEYTELPHIQRRFLEAYGALKSEAEIRRAVGQLSGPGGEEDDG